MLFVPSLGGGIKQGLSEVWTVQVLMTHTTSLHWQVYNSFSTHNEREEVSFRALIISTRVGEKGRGDFNKTLNLYSLLRNLRWFATRGASCLFPKVSIITLAKLGHRAVKQPAERHIIITWIHSLEIKYMYV